MSLTYVVPITPRRPFRKGEFVDVMDRDGTRMSTRLVVRAGKRLLTTDCGRQWTQQAYWHGDNGDWPFPWIRRSRRKVCDPVE